MAGYNTTVEILRSGQPGLLVPRRGPSAEQRLRAGLFAAHGWVRWLDPDHLDTDSVVASVGQALADTDEPGDRLAPDLAGGSVAASALLELLRDGGDSFESEPHTTRSLASRRASR
jgi:predicted glycosyltransferase